MRSMTSGSRRAGVLGVAAMFMSLIVVALPTSARAGVSAAVVDASWAATQAEASAIARQFGHPVVANDVTTQTSLIEILQDGSSRLTATSEPARRYVQDHWADLDLTLTQAADGSYQPRVPAGPVSFSGGGSGPMLRFQPEPGRWLSVSSPFGVLPSPTIAGRSATYTNVLDGVDLVLTAASTGAYEVLVVKSASASVNPMLSAVSFGLASDTTLVKKLIEWEKEGSDEGAKEDDSGV